MKKTQIDIIARQQAARIASKLDQADGKDNFISKDTWKYAMEHYGAKKVDVCISVFNAEKSIAVYIKRELQKNGGDVNEIGERWYNEYVEFSKKNKKTDEAKSEPKPKLESKSKLLPVLGHSLTEMDKARREELNKRFMYPNASKEKVYTVDDVQNLMKNEVTRRNMSDYSNKIDFDYWTEKVCNVANQYNAQPALLVAIMAQESGGMFTKGVDKPAGRGPMGITTIAVKDYFLGDKKGLWYDAFYELDSKLLTEIVYKKENNNMNTYRFDTPEDVRDNCAKDEEFGLKVGLLAFKMNYVKEVAKYFNGLSEDDNVDDKTVIEYINKIKKGELKITEKENEIIMDRAARNYNGNKKRFQSGKNKGKVVREVYRTQVIDSLRNNGYNFRGDYLIERKKQV